MRLRGGGGGLGWGGVNKYIRAKKKNSVFGDAVAVRQIGLWWGRGG